MLDVTGMSADAQLQLTSKDCGIKMRMSGNHTACSDSSLKLGTWAVWGGSPGTEQSEVELPSLMQVYSWKSRSEKLADP